MPLKNSAVHVLLLLVFACSEKGTGSGFSGAQKTSIDNLNKQLGAVTTHTPAPLPPEPTAVSIPTVTRETAFSPASNPNLPTDFLFVFDNSVSMEKVLQGVYSSFDRLQPVAFPPNSKLAVMTTMVGNPADLSHTHASIAAYPGIEWEPGFLSFVDKAGIQRFKSEMTKPERNVFLANSYQEEGCDAWFSPGQSNANGFSCLRAHLQNPLWGVGCEPGARAFSQLLDKHAGTPLFRDKANINVIFVSDTHDPGCGSTTLPPMPTAEELIQKVKANTPSSRTLKFHGVVPRLASVDATTLPSDCTAEGYNGGSYFTLIDATSGKSIDVCTASSYDAFARGVVEERTGSAPEVVFDAPVERVVQVLVQGTPYANYQVVDGNKVRVLVDDSPMFSQDAVIQITVVLKTE